MYVNIRGEGESYGDLGGVISGAKRRLCKIDMYTRVYSMYRQIELDLDTYFDQCN